MSVVDNVANSADDVFSNISSYAKSHGDGIIALCLLVGVVIAFSGRILLRPTVFLLGFVPTATSVTAFGVAVVADHSTGSAARYNPIFEALVVLFAIALGLAVGIVMVRLLFRVATFLLCGGFGAVLVLIVYMLLLQPATSRNGLLVWYAAMILAGLLTALLSVRYPDTAVILGTSFDGAALAVFSVARFLGHQPHLLSAVPPGNAPLSSSIDHWWSIAYAVATVLLALFGALAQRRVALADHIIAERHTQRVTTHLLLPDANAAPFGSSGADEADGRNGRARGLVRRPRYLVDAGEEHRQLVTVIEPPRSPSYRRSGSQSPPLPPHGYGATGSQDAQYSVVHNLGAEPLAPSVEPYTDRNVGGPL